MTAFLKLTGHPDSFTTKNGPALVAVASIEQVTSWQGGSRIVTTSGSTVYVTENVEQITTNMQEAVKLSNGGDDQ